MALGSTGCFLTERPDFDPPRQTPPFMTNVNPSTTVAHTIPVRKGTDPTSNLYESQPIGFDIMSEDLGEKIQGLILLDFKGFGSTDPLRVLNQEAIQIDPGTLKDKERERFTRTIQIPSSVQPDCHTVTVLLSHSFFPGSAKPQRIGDVDTKTWFFQVGANDDEDQHGYKPCVPEPRQADAGADATDGGRL